MGSCLRACFSGLRDFRGLPGSGLRGEGVPDGPRSNDPERV